ncbi:hypothetical protein DXG01_001996 [Tephrocybe rancida]|nr:hypothetical protein DXG01_001996 [Tephrocybe rancida]
MKSIHKDTKPKIKSKQLTMGSCLSRLWLVEVCMTSTTIFFLLLSCYLLSALNGICRIADSGVCRLICHTARLVCSALTVAINHLTDFGQQESEVPSQQCTHEPCPPAESTRVTSPPTSLFAVIIGIDKYKHPGFPDLHGAVNDAIVVKEYLMLDVGVSKDRIISLHDKEATQEEILETIHSLAYNNAIGPQDPILIYYAGHGSEAAYPVFDRETDESSSPSAGQSAYERQGHGVFTLALLDLFKSTGLDNLTYMDVIDLMPELPLWKVFSLSVAPPRPATNHIHLAFDHGSKYTLGAGKAHGVANGAEFTVYSNTTALGSVVTVHTAPFTTHCSVVGGAPFPILQPAHATQTRVGKGQDLRLLINRKDPFLNCLVLPIKDIHISDPGKFCIRILDNNGEELDLVISTHGGLLCFEDKRICHQFDLTNLLLADIRVNDKQGLTSFLRHAANFYCHLFHSSTNGLLRHKIEIKRLILVDVNGTARPCYKIINTSNVSLYMTLLLFSVSDISIGDPGGNSPL